MTGYVTSKLRRWREMFAALRAKTPSDAQDGNCYDLAREYGLIGVVRNAPRDLSTNRKRLQGFGRR